MSEAARRIDAATVPALILTLGLLVLAADAGGPRFSALWPVLLVVYGALRSAAYWARRPGASAPSRDV